MLHNIADDLIASRTRGTCLAGPHRQQELQPSSTYLVVVQAFDKRLPHSPGTATNMHAVIVFLLQSRVGMEQAKAGLWEASLANAFSAAEAGLSSH